MADQNPLSEQDFLAIRNRLIAEAPDGLDEQGFQAWLGPRLDDAVTQAEQKNPAGAGQPQPSPSDIERSREFIKGLPSMARENLPAIGGTVGGMAGPGLGIGSVLAGILGAAGRGGQLALDAGEKLNEIGWLGPMGSEGVAEGAGRDIADMAATGAAEGATNYAGGRIVNAGTNLMRGMSRAGMQSAIKPETAFLKKAAGAARKGIDPVRLEIIDDLLKQPIGNPMAPRAAGRVQNFNEALKFSYDKAIANAPDVPMPGHAAAVQRQLARELRRAGRGTAPQADQEAVRNFIKDVNSNPNMTTLIPGQSARQVPTGAINNAGQSITSHVPGTPDVRVPRNLTPREAQVTGSADNPRMAGLFAGRTKDPEANALKAVMGVTKSFRDRAAKTEDITDMMRRGINMEKVSEAARKRAANTYPFNLTDVGAVGVSAAMGNWLPVVVSTMMKPRPLAAGSRLLGRTGRAIENPNAIAEVLTRLLAAKGAQEAVEPDE